MALGATPVVVFDSDVLIGFLDRDDAHHVEAVARVRAGTAPGIRRAVCAVNYAELLIGPFRAGTDEVVRTALRRLSIEIVDAEQSLSDRAAYVRAQTNLKLPDAFAVATALALDSPSRGRPSTEPVRLESFDKAVVKAHERLRDS